MANPFEDLDKPDPVPSKGKARPASRKLKPHKGPLLQSLATLSFLGPFFVAPIVWLMARHDLKEMDAGRMDRAGRPQTRTARGLAIIPAVAGVQRAVRPAQHQAEVVPVIVTTDVLGCDVVDLDLRQVLQRQPGDGAPVLLPLQEVAV